LNDVAYRIFNITYAIGCCLAPIIGGVLNDNYSFSKTCDIMGFGLLITTVFFFSLSILPGFFYKEERKIRSRKTTNFTEDNN
jgi:dipeptide/tripeptide permease